MLRDRARRRTSIRDSEASRVAVARRSCARRGTRGTRAHAATAPRPESRRRCRRPPRASPVAQLGHDRARRPSSWRTASPRRPPRSAREQSLSRAAGAGRSASARDRFPLSAGPREGRHQIERGVEACQLHSARMPARRAVVASGAGPRRRAWHDRRRAPRRPAPGRLDVHVRLTAITRPSPSVRRSSAAARPACALEVIGAPQSTESGARRRAWQRAGHVGRVQQRLGVVAVLGALRHAPCGRGAHGRGGPRRAALAPRLRVAAAGEHGELVAAHAPRARPRGRSAPRVARRASPAAGASPAA